MERLGPLLRSSTCERAPTGDRSRAPSRAPTRKPSSAGSRHTIAAPRAPSERSHSTVETVLRTQTHTHHLAERHFRKAVELHPRDGEAWVCLAASYDRLKRFDLADRAYGQAIKILGHTPEIMNNQGFSYMLRGEHGRARSMLLAAQSKDPKSPFIANNLRLLDESGRKAKAIN